MWGPESEIIRIKKLYNSMSCFTMENNMETIQNPYY